MIRIVGFCFSLILLLWLVEPIISHPNYLELFKEDPFRRADVDGCDTCHVSPNGGGPRNEHGSAFEAADHIITPMLRANFPDRYEFATAELKGQMSGGKILHLSDPTGQYVVLQSEDTYDATVPGGYAQDFRLIDLENLSIEGGGNDVIEVAPPSNSMSFFLTSEGPGNGARLGGLAGADRYCQSLAETVDAGGDVTWRAYLSTSFAGEAAVNAGDRIGTGPWHNAKGIMIAKGVADLHSQNRLSKEMAINERGEQISGRGDDPNRHDILTGSQPDGTAAVDQNCDNWTSNSEGTAIVGHHDREGRGETGPSWNAAHPSRGCSQENLRGSGGDGLFYCFALSQ